MRLSHILYKVKNLHEAVADFEKMGFTVRYGTRKDKAFNALIWFEDGPFIELFAIKNIPSLFIFLAKRIGKEAALQRFEYYSKADYGWVDYAIENDRYDLDKENNLLTELGYKYSTLPGSRKNIEHIKLKWKLSIPFDLGLPFLMSAYKPNPRPYSIQHANGAKRIKALTWHTSAKHIDVIRELTTDGRLKLEEGSGFGRIDIEGWHAERLNRNYYK